MTIRFHTLKVLCLTGLAVFSSQVVAQTDTVGLSAGNVVKALISLLLVLLFIVLLMYSLRRIQNVSFGNTGQLKLLSSLSVGQRERIVLVQVGTQQLLLGVAANQVNLIKQLEQPLTDPANEPASGQFSEQLSRLLKRQP